MALDTYANLKTAIADYLDRDDLTSNIDDFIDIAEARHKREIRIREQIERAQANMTARYTALPSGFLEMRSLRLLTDPVTLPRQVNIDEMNRLRRETTGKPKYFCIHEELEVDVTPDTTYSAEMIYYGAFSGLSDAVTSNTLLTKAPDVYLYASLAAAAPFLVDDERIALWEQLYRDARDTLMSANRKAHYGSPLFSRPIGATP